VNLTLGSVQLLAVPMCSDAIYVELAALYYHVSQ